MVLYKDKTISNWVVIINKYFRSFQNIRIRNLDKIYKLIFKMIQNSYTTILIVNK